VLKNTTIEQVPHSGMQTWEAQGASLPRIRNEFWTFFGLASLVFEGFGYV
jgi:hypothetical protein